jgi:hypothetical protein
MKRLIHTMDGKNQAGPHNLFPDWMKVLQKDSRFKQVAKKGFAYSDTDGLKVILLALFILHLMRPHTSVVHFNSMIKLIQADTAANDKWVRDTAAQDDTEEPKPEDDFGFKCVDWSASIQLFGCILFGMNGNKVNTIIICCNHCYNF